MSLATTKRRRGVTLRGRRTRGPTAPGLQLICALAIGRTTRQTPSNTDLISGGGIVFGLRRSDDRSFDALYLAEWRNVVGRAQAVVRDRFRAEELAQEAFTRAFDRWPSVSRHPKPAAWVMRVVANLAIDEVRKNKTPHIDLTQTQGHEDRVVDSLLVQQALAVLSGKQRDAIVLRYLMGCDEAEIAEVLHVNRGTVKTHLARGMARLRKEVGIDLDSEASTT